MLLWILLLILFLGFVADCVADLVADFVADFVVDFVSEFVADFVLDVDDDVGAAGDCFTVPEISFWQTQQKTAPQAILFKVYLKLVSGKLNKKNIAKTQKNEFPESLSSESLSLSESFFGRK